MQLSARTASAMMLCCGLSGTALAGCSPTRGSVASAARPAQATAAEALGEPDPDQCRDVTRGGRPLIVDLKPEQRADLEVAMSEGVAVVAYSCNKLELLPDCAAEGSYGFKGIVLKQQVIRLADADEIRANLPFSGIALASRLEGDLARGTTLDLATALVGNLTSTRLRVHRSELQGMCEGATHFVRGANVGAFVMQTGSQAEVATAAQLFGAGGEAGSQSSRMMRVADGRLQECLKSRPDSAAPPEQCRALLRLRLLPIATAPMADPNLASGVEAADSPPEDEETCPEGLVLSEGKCVVQAKARLHVCNPTDLAGCTEQCNQGEPQSCAHLARLYRRGKHTAPDATRAAELYAKACELNQASACSDLGILVAEGTGTPRDAGRAAELFDQACKLGEANGCFNLGTLYYDGSGVEKDPQRAFELFSQACNAGKAAGCINVGVAYDDGDGVARDPVRAFSLFKRACEGEEPLGCYNLAYMYSTGSGTVADQRRAAQYYERACTQGSAKGCEQIADRYLKGNGVAQDEQQASVRLQRACRLGSQSACAKAGQ
jgi:TPR repeat protein